MLKATQNHSKSRILSSPLIISGSRFPQRRHLASPSKPVNAATATLRKPQTSSYSIPNSHNAHHPSDYALNDGQRLEMRSFLRQKPLIVLPTPRPPKYSAPSTSEYHKFFPETVTLDKFAIMQACLKNNLDVPRAHQLFTEARKHEKLIPLLDTQAYNAFLMGYFSYAEEQEQTGQKAKSWRNEAWKLYGSMEEKGATVEPDLNTYSIMLRVISRSPDLDQGKLTSDIMKAMDRRKIQLSDVLHHDLISDVHQDVQRLLTRAATSSGSRQVIARKLAELGVQHTSEKDVLDSVPEIKTQVKKKIVKSELDGEIVNKEVVEVPYNLGVLRETLGQIIEGRKALPDDVLQRQKIIEETAYDSALARFKHEAEVFKEMNMGGGLTSKNMKVWIWEWYSKTIPLLKERIAAIKAEEGRVGKKPITLRTQVLPVYSFLSLLPPEKLVIISILELMTMIGSNGYQGGIKTARALITIGSAIEAEHHFQEAKKQNIPAIGFKSRADLPAYSVKGYLQVHKERVKAKLEHEGTENWMPAWTPDLRVRVGAVVMDALMEIATVTVTKKVENEILEEEQQAFYNTYRYENGFKIGLIKANDFIVEKMAREPDRDSLHPRHLPMLAPPSPWIRHNSGGYLYSTLSVMRMKESSEQNSYLKEADARGAMELIYAGLDVLGKTAWKINQPVFEVALEVWNKGLDYPRIPPLVLKQTLPEPPVDGTDMKAKSQYAAAMKQLANDRNSHHSERCSTNYKMEIARTFIGEKFYLPHNIDFRGRAYPIPPHLNHMGDDLSRGLLMFAESRPLGKSGLRWLKIHLSTLFGYDKASFDDREIFATEHLAEIYDSAENPITGRQWWLKADDPWQCLAACMELRNALESPNPEQYESCLPVHQDGTCNGLQHYAALGGDIIGAKQVNLDVSDRPSDVYTYVSEMVKAQISKDAANGDERALKLQGKVNRKVVKQTVMTTVYGVTFIGARDQIDRQLKNIAEESSEDTYPLANYLARVTLNCIGSLFKGAKDIQLWLNNCAKLISRSVPEDRLRAILTTNQVYPMITEDMTPKEKKQIKADRDAIKDQMTTVIWTTLLGLPVVQPYRKAGRKQIMTSMQSVYISDPNQPQAVNTVKQASAFPPNFVHSLDATHMMLTALQCDRQGLAFASVHDSYWTHAATVEDMSKVIRDSFVHLHSSNVLENLLKEFHERYRGYKLPIEALTQRTISKWITKDNLPEHVKDSLSKMKSKDLSDECESDSEEVREDASVTSEVSEDLVERTARKRKSRKVTVSETVDHKYVNLLDVLPPVPEKGKFDIQVVKDSPYFFS